MLQTVKNLDTAEKTNLVLGMLGTPLDNTVMPWVIRDFNRLYPEIKISIRYFTHDELEHALANKVIDAAIQTADDVATNAYFHLFAEGKFAAIIANNEPLAIRTELSIRSLDYHNLIFLLESQCSPQQKELQQKIAELCSNSTIYYANNYLEELAMAKTALGICILPFIKLAGFPQKDELVSALPIRESSEIGYGVVTKGKAINPATTTFINWIEQNKLS